MAGNLSLSGLVSGMDTESIIQKLMAVESRPIQLLQQKQTTLQDKASAWRDINTRLSNLQSRAADLADKLKFYAKKAVSGDTTVFDATASSSAAASSYSLTVQQLAQAHIVASAAPPGGPSDPAAALNQAGNPQINGKTIQVGVTDSLNSLRDKINATPDIGVTASVVQVDATHYQLVMTAKTVGSTPISFTDDGSVLTNIGILSGGVPNTVQAAQDAIVKINNLTVQRSSNTLSDVIPGVTLTLKKPSAGSVTLTVGQDYDAVVKAVHDFADQYNSVIDLINQKTSWDDKTKKGGTLFGDPTANQIKAQLRSMVMDVVPGTQVYRNFTDIGVTTGKYGEANYQKLQVDDTKLRQALTDNLDAVGQLLGVNEANVALATAGSTATASSTAAGFDPNNVLNGQTSSAAWGTPGVGWQDDTPGTFPDTLTINFGTARTLDKLIVYTLDSTTQPASTNGVRDYSIEYWDGNAWKLLTSVTGNSQGVITSTFGAINTSQVRLNITAANGASSNILQVQAFQPSTGVAGRVRNYIKGYTDSGTGMLDVKQKSLKSQMDDLSESIKSMQDRLGLREQTMRQQFTAMETALSKLKDQSAALNSMLMNSGR